MAACFSGSDDHDDFVCSTHTTHVVALYCQNCEELICPRCVSQGPSSLGLHKDHVYLDLVDAYNDKKEQFTKVLANFHDASQSKKNERVELNATIQKIKLELLRKRTAVIKELRSLRDTLSRQEQNCQRHLVAVVAPAVARLEKTYHQVDYDVVCREGLLGSAESIEKIGQEKCIQFLRGQKRVEKDMVELSSSSKLPDPDPLPELGILKATSLTLTREKSVLKRTYNFSQNCPDEPRILRSWCVVSENSASVVFKFSQKISVKSFVISCSLLGDRDCRPDNKKRTFRIRRFAEGRVTAVLRNIAPPGVYRVAVTAINDVGGSNPAVCYLHLPGRQRGHRNIPRITFHPPPSSKCGSCWQVGRGCLRLLVWTFLSILLAWAVYAMYLSWEQVSRDVLSQISTPIAQACHFLHEQNQTLLEHVYSNLCPVYVSSKVLDTSTTWDPGVGGRDPGAGGHDLGDQAQGTPHSVDTGHTLADQFWDWILWFY